MPKRAEPAEPEPSTAGIGETHDYTPESSADEPPEADLWFAWKRAYELVRAAVLDDVAAATGLSDADTGILLRLDDGGGSLRQSRLADALGWDRSRLSHQLTRMEARDLLTRTRVAGGVEIAITNAGSRVVQTARPIHLESVRRNMIDPLGAHRAAMLRGILDRLGGGR